MPLDPKQLASQFRSSRRLRTNSSPTDEPGIGGAQDTQNSCMRALRIVPLGNLRGIAAGGVGLHGVWPFHQEVPHHLGIRCLRSAVQRIGRVHQVPLRTGHSAGEAVHLQEGCDGCPPLAILLCAQCFGAAGCLLGGCTLRSLLSSVRLLLERRRSSRSRWSFCRSRASASSSCSRRKCASRSWRALSSSCSFSRRCSSYS
mmetsp:Transcript_28410/g.91458  ORF Transcript_28410/g.91458 Transcript_28410/m.91458 type:complete len:201 (-) Transcript_28410:292-894(-)